MRSSVFPNPTSCQHQHSLLACVLAKRRVPSLANLSATTSLRSIQQSLRRSNSEVESSDPQNSLLLASEFGPKLANSTWTIKAHVSAPTIHPNHRPSTLARWEALVDRSKPMWISSFSISLFMVYCDGLLWGAFLEFLLSTWFPASGD